MTLDVTDPVYLPLVRAAEKAMARRWEAEGLTNESDPEHDAHAAIAAILPLLDPYDGDHIVDVTTVRYGKLWTATHSLACRLEGRMDECPTHLACARRDADPFPAGRYRVVVPPTDRALSLEWIPIDRP